MSHTPPGGPEPDQPILYEVRIKGHLGARWNDWFDHLTITAAADGETILTGSLVDQAALHGVLTKIRDLGLQLTSVTRLKSLEVKSGDEDPTLPTPPPEQE